MPSTLARFCGCDGAERGTDAANTDYHDLPCPRRKAVKDVRVGQRVENVIGETLRNRRAQDFRYLTPVKDFALMKSVNGLKSNQRLGQGICHVLQGTGAETCIRNGGFQLPRA